MSAIAAKAPRYPIDPSVKGRGPNIGLPPDGHARRCQGTCKVTKKQCRQWAIKGRRNCMKHGGRIPLGMPLKKMGGFYAKYVGPTMRERLEELSKNPDMLDLTEEIQVAKGMAADAVKYLEAVMRDTDSDQPKISAETRALAVQTTKAALSHVAHLVNVMAKVADVKKQGGFTAMQLDWLVVQWTKVIWKAFGDDHAGAKKALLCLDQVKMPVDAKVRPAVKLLSLDGDVVDPSITELPSGHQEDTDTPATEGDGQT